jgi:hypothetical protein
MATKEIDESELLGMQHIAGVVDAVMKTPATRSQFLRLAKQAKPDLSIPEVDAAQPVIAAVQETNKRLNDFITAQAEKERKAEEDRQITNFQSRWAQDEADLRREGWRPTGIDQVKKFAEENGIANLRIAADAFERRNPQPGPVDSRAAGWNLFTGPAEEDTFVKDMMDTGGESETRLDKEIRDTLNEIRSGY